MFRDNTFYEVEHQQNETVQVPYEHWRAWTGRRFMNGKEYHGPIFVLNEDFQYKGKRVCACDVCQSVIDPTVRVN